MSERKRITIACVNTALHEVGGETRRLRNLYNHINGPQYRFLIAYCSTQKDLVEAFFLEGGVKKEDLFHYPTTKNLLFIPLVLRLRKLFIREHVDIVHTFFLHSDILGYIASLFSGIGGRISNVEGKFLWDDEFGVGKFKQACYFLLNRLIRPQFYKTVAVSGDLKNELVVKYGVPDEKIDVISIGIEVPSEDEIKDQSSDRAKNGHTVIANAARFSKDKGLEYLVRAAPNVLKEIPEARFVIAGIGDEEANLKQLASDLGVESEVSFPGWTKDMNKFMKEIDIFAMTSIREGCPMSLSEALSYAKPAVAFDVPGPNEIINHEENGLLVEPFDVQKYSQALIRMCKDPENAQKMGRNGRKLVEEKLSVVTEANKLQTLYSELVNISAV